MSRSGSIMSQDNHLGGRNYSGSTLPLPHKETDDMMKYKTIAVSFLYHFATSLAYIGQFECSCRNQIICKK